MRRKPAIGSSPTRQGLPLWKCSSAINVMVLGFICLLHFARFPHPSGCETSGKSKTQGDNGLFRAADEWSGNQNHADFPWKTANPGLRKSRNVQLPSQGGLFLVAEGNEVRLQVSSQGLQGAAR